LFRPHERQVFGKPTERAVLRLPSREPSPYNEAGTVLTWQEFVSALGIGNVRLVCLP
jgi:hypothetical protein